MSTENKEFFDLLSSVVEEQTFSFDLSPRENPVKVSCIQLTTSQLKELIKTAVDSPLTQSVFNSTVTKIFKQSLVEDPEIPLTVIDRLLFILETRIHSLSPTKTVQTEGKTIEISFEEVRKKLKQQLQKNKEALAPASATEGKLTVTYGVALIDTEVQLNEELYKNIEFNIENVDELRKLVGEAFINEIAKTLQTITIEDKTLDLSQGTFKNRLKVIESLPASLTQKVIEYIEVYKKIISDCLTVEGYTIPIDSTLFTLR